MNNSLIRIDPVSIGSTVLVGVTPDLYGSDKVRHDVAVGYKYEVMLPSHRFDKLTVKIPGLQLMDTPVSGHEPTVDFENLVIKPYVDRNGRLAFTATATGVKVVATGDGKAPTKG